MNRAWTLIMNFSSTDKREKSRVQDKNKKKVILPTRNEKGFISKTWKVFQSFFKSIYMLIFGHALAVNLCRARDLLERWWSPSAHGCWLHIVVVLMLNDVIIVMMLILFLLMLCMLVKVFVLCVEIFEWNFNDQRMHVVLVRDFFDVIHLIWNGNFFNLLILVLLNDGVLLHMMMVNGVNVLWSMVLVARCLWWEKRWRVLIGDSICFVLYVRLTLSSLLRDRSPAMQWWESQWRWEQLEFETFHWKAVAMTDVDLTNFHLFYIDFEQWFYR